MTNVTIRLAIMWVALISAYVLSFLYPEEVHWWVVLLIASATALTVVETLILFKIRRKK